ncbi:amidohydrolase [Kangiella sp. HZ709]|uniref:amidohydrolase n=1 Tax=Kangiella sp. HZ709 TaxID=2666328 RepID=UPI0012B14123|nr:amidohydrolase [Kangiella sp. HZ709]MRX26799.1 amidohydrolase family protein [Kangiella sp. HZ709]
MKNKFYKTAIAALLSAVVVSCADDSEQEKEIIEPFASRYQVQEFQPVFIKNATILTAAGEQINDGAIYFKDGKIVSVGDDLSEPSDDDLQVIDAKGKWITPGIIDVHSHLGVYPAPGVQTSADGNEMTAPVTAEVWAEHSVWPQDPQFSLALAAGVTSMQILPGSANLVGGRSVTLKNVLGRSVMDMKFPEAPHGLKMACGENPKRVYGSKGRAPATRMGNVAGYRKSWIQASDYKKQWDAYNKSVEAGKPGKKPKRDLKLDTLMGVLNGEILVHNHCYRADEMAVMLDIAKEFDYKVSTFHHAIESYKIADLLAENDVCSAMWSDWWGFKQEAYDTVPENVALVDKAGACAIVHSDSAVGIQHLNKEAAKAMTSGVNMGLDIKAEDAIKWITINAAKAIGVEKQTGSLEEDKMADIVIWDGNPFSVYSKAEKVFIDGALKYDRANAELQPVSDFDLGAVKPEENRL